MTDDIEALVKRLDEWNTKPLSTAVRHDLREAAAALRAAQIRITDLVSDLRDGQRRLDDLRTALAALKKEKK